MSPAKRIVQGDDAEEILSPADAEAELDDGIVDVPATVVCAFCGDPDCPGCAEERSRSGVIAIIAWERPGSALSRLWWTARPATQNAEAFFESLPDGAVTPALRFAVFAELLASASMLVVLAGALALTLLGLGIFPDGLSLATLARGALVVVLGLTTLLVGAHAMHGAALELGARRAGASPTSMSRALRFGLYAAGWDVIMGPIGFFVLLLREGPKAAFGIARSARRLPTRSSLAFLRGAYRIDESRAKPALMVSYFGAGIATLLCALTIVGGVFAALIAR